MQGEQLNSALKRNIQMLGERRQREQDDASFQDRIAARITAFAGSMTFVFLHVVIVCVWLLMNSGLFPWLPAFDPDLVKLRSDEHTSELQSLMRISYAVFFLKKKNSLSTP